MRPPRRPTSGSSSRLEFDRYTIALLILRPDAPQLDEEAAAALQDAHLAHLADLHEAGHLLAAGPLSDEKFRGLSILNVDARAGSRAQGEGSRRPDRKVLRQGHPLDAAGRCDQLLADSVSTLGCRHRELSCSAPELHLVPGRDRRHLEQGAVAAAGVDVRELAGLVLPRDLEPAVLDPVVEPGAAEDELAQPVDE